MSTRRFTYLSGLVASWFLLIAFRLYDLQILRHDDYRARADRQQVQVLKIAAPRGAIFDRRDRELAISVAARSVAADPRYVENRNEVARELAEILEIDGAKVLEKLESDSRFVWIKRKVDPAIAEALKDLHGVFSIPESRRVYPAMGLAAQVVGFVGTDDEGLSGLEYHFDSVLRPRVSERRVLRDALFGKLAYSLERPVDRERGQDLHLTLDLSIQHIVERELEKAMSSSQAPRAMAVVMDPTTHDVLAMASLPSFDPNDFESYRPERWRNSAVTLSFEPGSILRPFMAVEPGAVDMNDLGLGRPTGIDLPGESRSSPDQVTAIQLTRAYASVVNRGRLLTPHVLAGAGRPGESNGRGEKPEAQALSPSLASQVFDQLRQIELRPGFVAPNYWAAAVAGTASEVSLPENGDRFRRAASAVGFAPGDPPEVIVTVVLDEIGSRQSGAETALAVFREIARETLTYLGVPPERESAEDIRFNRRSAVAHGMPDFRGLSLRESLSVSSRHGLRLTVHGQGVVARQTPAQGSAPGPGAGHVELWLRSRD